MMNLALIKTRSMVGIDAKPISVEVHLSNGLPRFNLVGLPETAIKESKDRVRSAIINSQFEFPCRIITVNLAPADLPKLGSGFDLPIALGILAASKQIPSQLLNDYEFIGELALNGDLRGAPSVIPAILAARREQQRLILAMNNLEEATLTGYKKVYFAHNLREICSYLCKNTPLTPLPSQPITTETVSNVDWSDIEGQQQAKQALIIAAVGGHSILLYGPPGSGKTMLAKRFITLLPELSEEQGLESVAIHALRGKKPNFNAWRTPPFRSPHHTASAVALVGGGNPPKPGEITLAHHGVLFLDELPEFNRQVLETLREPLESGQICISRASMQTEFPAQFLLIAAMNPCPCGQWGNPHAQCICSTDRINRYLGKLSGPFLDRIDLQINIQALPHSELITPTVSIENESPAIKAKVTQIRELQLTRQGCLNANLPPKTTERMCNLGSKEQAFLHQALERLKLSARAYHRLLKVARTIADTRQEKNVELAALQQALAFKQTLQGPK